MKVAIYARVSTDEQTEQNQVSILEVWANNRGWKSLTGTVTWARPGRVKVTAPN